MAGKHARTEVECSNGLIFFEPPNELLVPIFCKPVIGNPVDKEFFLTFFGPAVRMIQDGKKSSPIRSDA